MMHRPQISRHHGQLSETAPSAAAVVSVTVGDMSGGGGSSGIEKESEKEKDSPSHLLAFLATPAHDLCTLQRRLMYYSVPLLVFALSLPLVALSWWILLRRAAHIRRVWLVHLLAMDAAAALVDAAAHALEVLAVLRREAVLQLLLLVVVRREAPSWRLWRQSVEATRRRRTKKGAGVSDVCPRAVPWLEPALRKLLRALCLLPILWSVAVKCRIAARHRQTQEIVLILGHFIIDGCFSAAMLVAIAGQVAADVWPQLVSYTRHCLRGKAAARLQVTEADRPLRPARALQRTIYGVALAAVLLAAARVVGRLRRQDIEGNMRTTVLGDDRRTGRTRHACEVAGSRLIVPPWWRSVLLHDLLPRRFFNFFTGSEACSSGRPPRIAFIDSEEEVLVVAAACPADSAGPPPFAVGSFDAPLGSGGSAGRPRVLVERPMQTELAYDPMDTWLVDAAAPAAYTRWIEETYGADPRFVIRYRRDEAGREKGAVAEVEWRPEVLPAVARVPKTLEEARLRSGWGHGGGDGGLVLRVPLGVSAAYTVACGSLEEYYVHPRARPTPTTSAAENGTSGRAGDSGAGAAAASGPPANLVIIFFDAVSRQEVVRSLPKFTAWMRRLGRRLGSSHVVVEARGHTTAGHSTAPNFVPSIAGSSYLLDNRTIYNLTVPLMPHHFMARAKAKYGDRLHTAVSSDYCHDIHSAFLNHTGRLSLGNGDPIPGMADENFFLPMCHLEFSNMEGSFQGPYSLVRRCIDGRHVHDYLLDYTYEQIRRRLREQRGNTTQPNRHFVDMSSFVEGHEGSHGVLALVDDSLVAFLERLLTELRYFDDPRNGLVFYSDHGSHMGPYYETSAAGKMERTAPVLLLVLPRPVLLEIDRRRGREAGTSERFLWARTADFTNHYDLYLTFCDLLDVEPYVHPVLPSVAWPPASLFTSHKPIPPWTEPPPDLKGAEWLVRVRHYGLVLKEGARWCVDWRV